MDDAALELLPLGVGEVVGGVGDPDFIRASASNLLRNWLVCEVILDDRSEEEREKHLRMSDYSTMVPQKRVIVSTPRTWSRRSSAGCSTP